MRSVGCIVMLVWLLARAGTVLAQDAQQLESAPAGYAELADEAYAEHTAGNFAEAHALYARAHALWPSARTLNYLAITEFELKRYAECIAHLEQALASNVRPLTGELRKQAEALLARVQPLVARVFFELEPSDARMLIDGEPPRTRRDGSVRLGVGEHAIELSADGYRTEQRKLLVKAGGEQRVRYLLEPIRSAPPQALTARDEDDDSLWESPWLWTTVGVIAAGAAVAALLLVPDSDDTVIAQPKGTARTPGNTVLIALTRGGE